VGSLVWPARTPSGSPIVKFWIMSVRDCRMSLPPEEPLLLLDDEPDDSNSLPPWLIALVDDEPDVHHATTYALAGVKVLGRPLQFVSAYSGREGAELLARHGEEVAVALIDVVMEDEHIGLELVQQLRGEFGNGLTRVVLRTGQPGYAPELEVMHKYDINDYRTKSELTFDRLLTTLTAAIRAYQQVVTLERSRRGLDLIVHATADLSRRRGLTAFASGVIQQIAALLGLPPEGLLCVRASPPAEQGNTCIEPWVVAAAGSLAHWTGLPLSRLRPMRLAELISECLDSQTPSLLPDCACLFFRDEAQRAFAVYVETPLPLSTLDRQLLQVFSANIGTGFDNVSLIERLEQLAYVDALTALPNRTRFLLELDEALGQGRPLTMALIDVNGFSGINNAVGHQLGNGLLRAIGERLARVLDDDVTVARLSSDLFALFGSPAQIQPDALMAVFAATFAQEQVVLLVTASIGLVAQADLGQSAVETLRRADIALHQAKLHPERRFAWFESYMEEATLERLDLLQQLRQVVQQGGLRIYFQPQVALSDGEVIGVEALLRWQRTDGSFVPPDRFIPLAEASGEIIAIGDWVLRSACQCLARWEAQGRTGLRMAVNVSLVQFRASDFVERVAAALRDSGIEPSRLELEITESVAMAGFERIRKRLRQLKALGVQVAIDDFGTGFSSLSYLQELAVDRLKIDRGFVVGLPPGSAKLTIAEGIVRLARDLDIPVIAEGVERPEQAECLRQWGCQEAQGYLYSPALAEEALLVWLDERAPALKQGLG